MEIILRLSQFVLGGVDEEENVSDFKFNIFNVGEYFFNYFIYLNDIRLVFNRVVCISIYGMVCIFDVLGFVIILDYG